MVCDALVVSAGRHRDDAAVDDTSRNAARGIRHDAPCATDAARLDASAASGGHVFCLTTPVTEYPSG